MYQKLRDQVYNRLLDIRNVERMVAGDAFKDSYEAENPQKQEEISKDVDLAFDANPLTRELAFKRLKKWLRAATCADIGIHELREQARSLGIPRWSRLDKSELLSSIRARTNGKASCNGTSGSTHNGNLSHDRQD